MQCSDCSKEVAKQDIVLFGGNGSVKNAPFTWICFPWGIRVFAGTKFQKKGGYLHRQNPKKR